MLFKRRTESSAWERFRVWLWPRVSWRRSGRYHIKRLLRLSGSPYALAMGFAVGAAVSITPFLGLHLLIAFAIAWVLRANLIAGAIGTVVGNPLTFPFIWAGTFELGHLVLRGFPRDAPARLERDLEQKSFDQLWPVLEPMLIGSIPIGLAVGCVSYFIVYKAVRAYQEARRDRFAERRGPESEGRHTEPARSGSPT